jgi:hypothetical protein
LFGGVILLIRIPLGHNSISNLNNRHRQQMDWMSHGDETATAWMPSHDGLGEGKVPNSRPTKADRIRAFATADVIDLRNDLVEFSLQPPQELPQHGQSSNHDESDALEPNNEQSRSSVSNGLVTSTLVAPQLSSLKKIKESRRDLSSADAGASLANDDDDDSSRHAEFVNERRRIRRELRRRAKLERHERQRLLPVYPVREWTFRLPCDMNPHPVMINPCVTGAAVACLWGLVIWSSGTSSILGECLGDELWARDALLQLRFRATSAF